MGLEKKHKPESGRTFELIFDNITEGVCLVDSETARFSLCNRAMADMLGIPIDEMTGMSIYEIHPVESHPVVKDLFNKLLNRQIDVARNVPVVSKNKSLLYAEITASHVMYEEKPHLITTFRNVTGLVEAEKQKDVALDALRKSEAKLNAFIDRAAIAIAISKDQKLTFVNPAFMTMFGYEHETELIGVSIYDIITMSEHSKVKAIENASEEKTQLIYELETEVKRKDGREFWIHAAISDVYDYGSLGFITDITDRVMAEKELLRKEKLLGTTLNTVADGILLVDSNNKISHMNRQFLSMWNVPPDASESKDDGVILDSVREQVMNPDAFTEKVRMLYECDLEDFDEIRLKNGKVFERYSASIMFDGTKFGRVWDFRDITKRKEAEEVLRKNEGILKSLLEGTPVGIVLLVDRVHVKVNQSLCRMLGYSEGELIGHNTRFLYTSDEEYEKVGRDLYGRMEREGLGILEARLKRKDGVFIDVLLYASAFNTGDVSKGVTVSVFDITERKKAEKELRENEAMLSVLFETAPVGITLLVDRVHLKINSTLCRMTGYSMDEILGHSVDMMYYSREQSELVSKEVYADLAEKGYTTREVTFKRKDGTPLNAFMSIRAINQHDLSQGIVAISLDMGDLKRTQQALEESEEKYRTLVDNMQDAVYRCDLDGTVNFATPSAARLLAYETVEELIGKNVADDFYFHPGERDSFLRVLNEKGKVTHHEVMLKRRDGSPLIVSANVQYYYGKNGNIIGIEGVYSDITERKRVEVELKNNEAVLRGIFDASPAGIALLTPERAMLKVNHSLARITGFSEQELLGKITRFLYYNDEEFNKVGVAYQEMQRDGLGIAESCLKRKDGSVLYVIICLSPVNPENIDAGIVATVLDITDLKMAEQALRESEEKYRTLVENMQDAAYRCDLDGRIIFTTPSAARMTGCPSAEAMTGMSMWDFYYQPDDREKFLDDLDGKGRLTHYELKLKRMDGTPLIVSANVQYYHDKDGNVAGVEGVFNDITERKQAEEELKKSETLLRSIFDTSPAGLLVLVDRIPAKVNRSFCRLTGYSEEELVGQSTRKLYFTDQEYDHVGDKYYERNSENVSVIETCFRRKDGSAVDSLICLSPINPADKKTGYVAITLDISERKRAEEALEESEEKYRTLVENMQDAAYRCDLNGDIVFTSPSAARMLGAPSVESLVGRSIARDFYYCPDEREKLVNELKEHGKVTNFEVTLRRMDNGEPVIISTNSQLYRDKDGNVIGIEGVFSDITDRKRAEKALRESEEFLRKIFDVTPIGIILLEDRIFVKVNDYICRVSGYSEEELLRQPSWFFYTDDEEYNRVGRELYSHMEKEGTGTIETYLKHKNGSIVSVLLSMTRLNIGDIKNGVIVTVVDITERKNAEEALRKNEAVLKSLLDATPIGVGLIINRVLVKVNNSLCRIMGYSERELIGQSTRMLYTDENEYNRIGTELYAKMESTGLGMNESILKRRDGTVLNAILCLSPFDSNDTSAGVTLTVFDITERKKMEAEKLRLEEMLLHSQKLESIGRLAGGIAHDFNNLLTAIMGNTEMAMKQLDPSGKPYSRLEVVKKAANGAANLTRQLLAFSRKQVIEPKEINFDELLQHVCKMIPALIGENIRLNVLLSGQMSLIKADAGQVEQIIINLVTNARDAMPDGGDLTIETAVVFLDENYSHLHPGVSPGSYVMMVITDTGAGMSGETLEHAFEPFFTTKETGRGTGLGLATVYGIVKQNGGTIEVYSEIGRGTSLKVYFPVVSESGAGPEHDTDKEVIPIGTETILIVEDKSEVLEFCRDVLMQSGYNVLSASSGEEALTVAENYRDTIHMLVTDVILPGINGRVTAERITSMRPGIKVLYTSGYTAEVIDKQGILEKGINYLNKPFTSHEFSVRIRDVLDKKS